MISATRPRPTLILTATSATASRRATRKIRSVQAGEGDTFWMLTRFGVDFRYQKSTEVQIVMEQRTHLDGNTSDDRFNSTNPGGTDIFGRAASTENKGFYCKYCWLDYKFEGTPLRMRVGFDLWTQDQAGYIGDNDPRFALFGEFGDIDVMAAAVVELESQRLGLTNDNDLMYYTFSAGYNLKPHRFQFDVTYFRDRFNGADTSSATGAGAGSGARRPTRCWSWPVGVAGSGRCGPWCKAVGWSGTAKGANAAGIALAGLTGARGPDRNYDVVAGSAVAYAEADLGIVRPFVMALWATGDGDPTDHQLHGFNPYPYNTTIQMTGTSWFAHLETSNAFSARDYACPARARGWGWPTSTLRGWRPRPIRAPGIRGAVGRGGDANPTQVVRATKSLRLLASGSRRAGAAIPSARHTVTSPFNDRLGNTSPSGDQHDPGQSGHAAASSGGPGVPAEGL